MNLVSVRIFAVLCLIAPPRIFAGSFTALPIKLSIDSRAKTEVLRIRNQGDEKVTVQLDAKAWSQDETGEDVYKETKDIVFFPKIADIAKGEDRLVRVGYQGQSALPEEKTYRLFLEELPVTKPGELAMKFALRLGIPIFVKPVQDNQDWSIDRIGLSEERLSVTIRNTGNAHVIANKITAAGIDDSGKESFARDINGWYVLAGVSKPFSINVPRRECLRTRTINVTVEVGKTTRESAVNVDKSMCTPKPANSRDVERGVWQ